MECFEGPEKKLEIILSSPLPGLRDNGSHRWTGVVRACGASIIRHTKTPLLDAYLLSESSLFVWDDRILLITCGQTSPVTALPTILDFVEKDHIGFLFYERQAANFPERQPSDFTSDEALLKRYLPGTSTRLGRRGARHLDVFYYAAPGSRAGTDATLQVLMYDIDPSVGSLFSQHRRHDSRHRRLIDRVRRLCGGTYFDGHLFFPQGYSANNVERDRYVTVHVTPQPRASYTSLETNGARDNFGAVVEEAVSIFKPGQLAVVVTESTNGKNQPPAFRPRPDQGCYRLVDHCSFEFDHCYRSSYLNYLEET